MTDAPRVAIARLRRGGAMLALSLGACVDTTTPRPAAQPIGEADVQAVSDLAAQLEGTMADPTLVSLLGVRVPFQSVAPEVMPRVRHVAGGAALQMSGAGRVSAFLGDAPVNPSFLGATFVRAGTVFRRDTARRDAPANAVRVLLYERVGGAATPNVVGWVDMADSVRAGTSRVTRATIGTPSLPRLATVRGSVTLVPQGTVGGVSLYDVLAGTIGGGSQPLVLSDSFVVDSSTSDEGRNVITTAVPAAHAQIRVVTPSAPGLTFAQSRMFITVGDRTVRVEEFHVGGVTFLSFYDGNTELGSSNTGYLPNLGDAAQTRYGSAPSLAVRRWMNAVGRLLRATPVAADLAQATGDLVTLLDPVIP